MQVKSEDLKVFVEVLQRLNPEPADMLQLRASEAQLRSKVAKLQADAAGHPLQQTIKQLQQAEVSNSLTTVLCACCRSAAQCAFWQGLRASPFTYDVHILLMVASETNCLQ